MKLYQDYFHEFMELFPTANDMLGLKEYHHLKSQYENSISESHIQKQKKLFNKYLNKIRKIKNKTHYDLVLEFTLQGYLESLQYDFHLIPLNHSDNTISYYVEMATGETLYTFQYKSDYYKFIEKTHNFAKWIQTSIDNMKLGIKKGLVLPKLLTKLLLIDALILLSLEPTIN